MFYSQCLLSRKGPLGAVLVAAYCHRRLKKAQVIRTDIPFSVEKILDEGFSAFTYRILGYLLLGVVRIYSHKVEYVLLDCNQMLLIAEQAVAVKRKEPQESSFIAPNRSITLPDSFELDKFIFEDMGVGRRDHVLPEEEIMLKDSWAGVEAHKFSPNELRGERVSIDLETFPDSGARSYNILSPYSVDMSLDDNLLFDMDIERSIETLIQKLALPVEACEAEMVVLPIYESSFHVMSNVKNDENDAQNLKQAKAESLEGERERAKKLSVTVEISPERNFTDHSDGGEAPQVKPLPTPINIENVQVKRKRKSLFDEQVVLNNKTVKENLNYSSDLVRKRGRVPQTALGVWKHGLMLNIKHNLTRPLIHCAFLDSKSCHYDDKSMSAESPPNLEASRTFEMPVSSDDKNTDAEKGKIDVANVAVADAVGEHIAIAPETPHRNARLEGFPLGEGFKRVQEGSSSNTVEEELDMEDHEELPTEVNISFSSEADFEEPDGWSASTRKAVQDFSSAFYAKNEQLEMQQVNLQEAAKGQSKNKSAKLFYDILVLKSRGMVNVQQHKPYIEILVTKSSGWEDWN